jgi:hypothetical protein
MGAGICNKLSGKTVAQQFQNVRRVPSLLFIKVTVVTEYAFVYTKAISMDGKKLNLIIINALVS